jgi:hypothetical protein
MEMLSVTDTDTRHRHLKCRVLIQTFRYKGKVYRVFQGYDNPGPQYSVKDMDTMESEIVGHISEGLHE